MSKQEQGIKLFGKTITLKPTTEQKDQNKESHDPTVEKRPDKIIPCPRCMSMETKFCYYNNYNVNQPRHFCKGCQRYWTAGGALRNVPVGAGRRKSKPVGRVNGLGGFVEEFIYEGGSGGVVDEFELNGVVLEKLHVAAHGGFPHVFPLKRRRFISSACELYRLDYQR